jgi:hypothetical protein
MIPVAAQQCRFCRTIFNPELQAAAQANIAHPGWKTVRNGLRTVYICLITIFLALILMLIIVAGAGLMMGREPGAALVLIIIPALVIVGAAIGIVVGQFMCCAVPPESGAKAFALTAAFCIIANILSNIGAAAAKGSEMEDVISGIGGLASLVGNIMFILFIRKIARHLGNEVLASSAMKFLLFLVAIVVGAIVFMVLTMVAQAPALMAVFGIAAFVLMIVAFIWYLRLLGNSVQTIDTYRTRGGNVSYGFPVVTQ